MAGVPHQSVSQKIVHEYTLMELSFAVVFKVTGMKTKDILFKIKNKGLL